MSSEAPSAVSCIPSWRQPKVLCLVWPEDCGRPKLARCFATFIMSLPAGLPVGIVVHSISGDKEARIRRQLQNRSVVTFIVLPTIQDLWICDWAPINVESSGIKAVKARYNPRYLHKYPKFSQGDEKAGQELPLKLGMERIDFPLILDGGNFTHNGKGIAIVTERLLSDNAATHSEADIRRVCSEYLGIRKLIIVPEEPGDDTGHIDGYTRFVGPRSLVVAAYPKEYEHSAFMDDAALRMKEHLGSEFRIKRLMNAIPADDAPDGIPSAVGNYVNFVRLGDAFVVPQYGIPSDKDAADTIATLPECKKVILTDPQETVRLAQLGGVYQCASWIHF